MAASFHTVAVGDTGEGPETQIIILNDGVQEGYSVESFAEWQELDAETLEELAESWVYCEEQAEQERDPGAGVAFEQAKLEFINFINDGKGLN
jgi:hypothetical protein